MKATASISLIDRLRGFTNFFKSSEGFFTFPDNKGKIQARSNGDDSARNEDLAPVQWQRKVYIGNYFAGPHCVFDPRLLNYSTGETQQ